ncbi:uncharacterized protein LOC135820225 [Sycon ciliatum]|uniref:uncharacterized protein LOC135820225 n=1 Tax=Sycon ciliatum TaxID=27933 RepID=UPI0031F6CBC1
MDAADRKKQDKVLAKLRQSFCMTKAQAYSAFTKRKLRIDESPDAYVADLQRLYTLAGHAADDDKDALLIEQMIAGLSSQYARELRFTMAGKELSLSGCLDVVRALRSANADDACGRSEVVAVTAPAQAGQQTASSDACYLCGEVGHIKRFCPKRQSWGRGRGFGGGPTATTESTATAGGLGGGRGGGFGGGRGGTWNRDSRPRETLSQCYFCDGVGHLKRDCPERNTWQESKSGTAASAVGNAAPVRPTMSEDATCLCSVAEATRASLPRLFLDLRSSASVRNGWARARSAIDTCARYTMVTASFLRAYDIDYDPGKPRSIVAVDGKPVKILGETDLQLQRMDGPVSLPRVHVKACAVGSLAAVGADILLGADVIAGVGGVSIGYGNDGEIDSANFGPGIPSVSATAAPASDHPLRHVTVTRDAKDVTLAADEGQVHWDDELKKWTLQWRWKDGQEPSHPIGSGIGQYARTNLSAEQETQFCDEVDSWVEKGWLVEHDEATHGSPTAVIPLLAKSQAHKSTTPVRPCLDYRGLNNLIKSNPGMDAPACAEKIRKWGQVGGQYELVDVRKAYLQVHVDPALLRYQVVVWRGKLYVMTGMGFGLSIAPKFMDVIVRWVTQPWPEAENYVDDVLTPADEREDVVAEFARYSLPTKPAEPLSSARVLGLQLSTPVEGDATYWSRRDGVDLAFQRPSTKRAIFQWTGRLTSHYPVGSWLRPACSYLKRMASVAATWDEPVPERVVQYAEEVADRLQQEDPVRGNWHVTSKSEGNWAVFCDASDIATGVVLQHNGNTIEDGTWLRDAEDINVAELDACIHGLSLAAEWGLSSIRLVTDSKTVFAWLQQVADNVRRVRLGVFTRYGSRDACKW